MDHALGIDPDNLLRVVQPGLINGYLKVKVAEQGPW